MDNLWHGLASDFQDLPDVAEAIRMSVRLLLAAVLGGLLGYEREHAGKSAGLRTHMLVSLGAALFVLIPQQASMSDADITVFAVPAWRLHFGTWANSRFIENRYPTCYLPIFLTPLEGFNE